jgi:hypothetical protein
MSHFKSLSRQVKSEGCDVELRLFNFDGSQEWQAVKAAAG